jgi:hypothetical protein
VLDQGLAVVGKALGPDFAGAHRLIDAACGAT